MISSADQTSSIDLNGWWQFAADPLDQGLSEGWYQPGHILATAIRVPGAWNAQGVEFSDPEQLAAWEDQRKSLEDEFRKIGWLGDQTESERIAHPFPGPGWYQRSVTVPDDWDFERTELLIEGVERSAMIWINGTACETITSHIVPTRVDITTLVKPGSEMIITIRVDSRPNGSEDPWWGSKDTIDYLFVTWGGLYGGVSLVGSAETGIDDVAFSWEPATPAATVSARVRGRRHDHLGLEVTLLDHDDQPVAAASTSVRGSFAEVTVPVAEARLWSPDSPYLYTLAVRLTGPEGAVDTHQARVGLRELRTEGSEFLLNGLPFFVRGCGDDAIFPDTIAPPADVETYRRRFRVAKGLGFNWVRLHSWVPPIAFLQAADELGMFVQPELPIAYSTLYPPDPSTYDTIRQGWIDLIKTHRLHPSVAVWCMGNEQYEPMPYAEELYRIAKELDPTRLVIDSDGVRLETRDRQTADFHVAQFKEGASIGWDGSKYVFEPVGKPVIAHEVGYFSSLPDPSQRNRFGEGLRPYWLLEAHDQIEQRGWQQEYPEMLRVSQELVRACLKVNTEAIRLSQLNGVSAWLIHDFPNCAEGIVDMFWEPKRVNADWFETFNGPVVVLMRDLERSHLAGSSLRVSPMISCFETALPQQMQLSCRLMINGQEIVECSVSVEVSSPRHPVESLTLSLPDTTGVTKAELVATASWPGGESTNSWDLRLFPAAGPATDAVVDVATGKQANAMIKSDGEPVLVSASWSAEAREQLANGGRVVLLDPRELLTSSAGRYRPASWDGAGHYGIAFDVAHPALAELASDGWADLDLYHVVEGAQIMELPSFSEDAGVLMRCVDLPSRLSLRGVLAEFAVGEGSVLVSGLNFPTALGRDDVAGRFLLDALVRYAASADFRPVTALPGTGTSSILV